MQTFPEKRTVAIPGPLPTPDRLRPPPFVDIIDVLSANRVFHDTDAKGDVDEFLEYRLRVRYGIDVQQTFRIASAIVVPLFSAFQACDLDKLRMMNPEHWKARLPSDAIPVVEAALADRTAYSLLYVALADFDTTGALRIPADTREEAEILCETVDGPSGGLAITYHPAWTQEQVVAACARAAYRRGRKRAAQGAAKQQVEQYEGMIGRAPAPPPPVGFRIPPEFNNPEW